MREIKFRAWDKDTGSWMYADRKNNSMAWFWNIIENYNCEIMQFTGLKDKNGKEIYEGDILQGSDTSPKYKVIFDSGRWGAEYSYKNHNGVISVYDKTIHDKQDIFEIIGNIYENPELAGGTTKGLDCEG